MTSYRPPYPPPRPPSLPPPHAYYQHPSHYPQAPPPLVPDPPHDKRASKQIGRPENAQQRPHLKNLGLKIETGEERRLRKKRELEKQRQEEKSTKQTNKTHNPSVVKKKPRPLLIENRLKKPTTFVCKFKFRNELPDQSAQLKLMTIKSDEDRYTNYTITSLEKLWKPKIFVEPELGIPLDLLDLSVYNPPTKVKAPLAPEDEALLRDNYAVTTIKKDAIRRKERPTDKGVSWLVKTEYISSINNESAKQSLTEKQAKELQEIKEGGGFEILHDLNNRDRQLKDIEASFEACKSSRPVHAINKNLQPLEVIPLLPYLDRYNDQFVVANFDSAPTADSGLYGKLNVPIRDEYEARAILKSYVVAGSDIANPDKFLAYMVPSLDEKSKDMYDENEDISYTWVREYHWDHGPGDDAYFVTFDDGTKTASYLPLHTKLNLRKKRARERKSSDEIEHFPVPSRVTVRRKIDCVGDRT